MTALFITGVSTEVGKTLAACALIETARRQGLAVDAFKPVSSGFDEPAASDAGRLLAALGRSLTPLTLDAIAPRRFAAPLSPPDAARRAGATLALSDIADDCRAAMARTEGLLLIEGAGGVMSPIANDGLNLDLMSALNLPVLLVAANYLGAVSHTLTAIHALESRGLRLISTVMLALPTDVPGPDIADTVATLRRYAPEAVIRNGEAWAAEVLASVAGG
jgi:dethiobiotin synthetase